MNERIDTKSECLTVGSLFSGIGGIDLGLERSGMRCAFQVEIDDYATRVLSKHWPDVPRFRDVRSVGAHNLPRVDVLAGGFPCQDISNAGRRIGITGARSGLWSEFARIIRELRPRYVLVENVTALLVRGMGAVLGDLAACGYDTEWECIPAAAVGAPHIRDRVFVLAYANGGERRAFAGGRDGSNGGDAGRQEAPSRFAICGQDGCTGHVADADRQRCDGRASIFQTTISSGQSLTKRDHAWTAGPDVGGAFDGLPRGMDEGGGLTHDPPLSDAWAPGWDDDVPRIAKGVPNRISRLRGLGNAVVPQVAEYVGRCIVAHWEATK